MKQLPFLFGLLFTFQLVAQNTSDALRYSTYFTGSTARVMGAGNAYGALGGDFSSVGTNPAGLAVYRRGEMVITPLMYFNNTETTLPDNPSAEESKSKFGFSNFGFVIANRPIGSKWKTSNFVLGLNRTANYHRRFQYEGITEGSITDEFLEIANGFTPDELDPFQGRPAFDVGAIFQTDPDNNPTQYGTDFLLREIVNKEQLVAQEGSTNEIVVSYAANYDEKFMVGATLGVPIVNFVQAKEYREVDNDGLNPVFNELLFNENITTTGYGINLKLGATALLTREFRVGLAYHSPSFLNFEESFSNEITYDYTLDGVNERLIAASADGVNDYKFRTPGRIIGSAAYLFGNNGFIGLDLERVNYGGGRFNYDDAFASEETAINTEIESVFKSVLNIRLGGEFAYQKLRLRAGYNISGNPYVDEAIEATSNAITGGIGFRGDSFFADLAYQRFTSKENYTPYLSFDVPATPGLTESSIQRVLLTFGFKF